MLSIGNSLSNSVYEANISGLTKPNAQSSREEKESWIRRKYEAKEFIPDINRSVTCGKLLIEAVVRYVAFILAVNLQNEELKPEHLFPQI